MQVNGWAKPFESWIVVLAFKKLVTRKYKIPHFLLHGDNIRHNLFDDFCQLRPAGAKKVAQLLCLLITLPMRSVNVAPAPLTLRSGTMHVDKQRKIYELVWRVTPNKICE